MNDEYIDDIYNKIKKNTNSKYRENIHPKLALQVMLREGRVSAFCVKAFICENTFYNWLKEHELFRRCYLFGNVFAREAWELEGYELRDMITPPGTINHAFDHWRMIGWSRFGISRNSRIKLQLNPDDSPDKHYAQLLRQASEGDFTAAELKQLMEAINVGLNTHQVFALQKEIDELKADLVTMAKNNDIKNNSGADQRIEKVDKDSV